MSQWRSRSSGSLRLCLWNIPSLDDSRAKFGWHEYRHKSISRKTSMWFGEMRNGQAMPENVGHTTRCTNPVSVVYASSAAVLLRATGEFDVVLWALEVWERLYFKTDFRSWDLHSSVNRVEWSGCWVLMCRGCLDRISLVERSSWLQRVHCCCAVQMCS